LSSIPTDAPPAYLVPASLARRIPHLPAFLPEARLLPEAGGPAPPGAIRLGPAGLRLDPAPWHPTPFAGRALPVALVLGRAVPVAEPTALGQARAVLDRLACERIGGVAGLPDPGPAALRCGAGEAVLVVDPCDPARAGAAGALLAAARDAAGGRPLRIVRSPSAPPAARPTLREAAGPLAPWTLLDAAAELWCLEDELSLLAAALGRAVRGPGAGQADGLAALAGTIAATRAADPFHHRPWSLDQALDQLAAWRAAEAGNRQIVVCLGMASWKRASIAAAFAHGGGAPAFRATARGALAAARRRGGALAVWASAMPPGLPARAAAAGVKLLRVEDGFIRSPGLGARFLPGGSVIADAQGVHYDASAPSDLETLLASAEFPPALLERAAALRQALVARGVTKYNLRGEAPTIAAPPGRRRILVPGQVEDDAQVRQPGAAIRTNLALLQAVRAAEPDAYLLYKPHPDLEAGYRKGRMTREAILAVADAILPGAAPLPALFGQVDALHTLSSLSGFEALLRGLPVTVWGRPFYAGWGLTEDRDPPPRRGRTRSLDELVAAALILYPCYLDPATGLPCPVEVLVERLDRPELWRGGGLRARIRAVEGALRRAWARHRGLQ
jgi:capsular polysaccharide export protein